MRSILKYIDEALFSSASEFSKADNIDEQEFVDLGLSVNWAKCNLGAEKETDYGHYYMWGSTKPNDNTKCYWQKTQFNNDKNYFDKEYFNSVKNKVCPDGILANKYDAAYKESHGEYRMPTKEEYEELIKNTDHKWIENYNGTKVNGMKFMNKSDKNNFIFIPAAGSRLNHFTDYINSDGLIWSVSIDTEDDRRAWHLYFCNDLICTSYDSRYSGYSVRPVQDK